MSAIRIGSTRWTPTNIHPNSESQLTHSGQVPNYPTAANPSGTKPKANVLNQSDSSNAFAESFTTQTLSAMLRKPAMTGIHNGQSRAMSGRPRSLYLTDNAKNKSSRGSKNYRSSFLFAFDKLKRMRFLGKLELIMFRENWSCQ